MNGILKQCWFLIENDKEFNIRYICCAENEEKIRESVGGVIKAQGITQLTWSQLSKFTGCIVPCYRKPDQFAKGSLTFRHEGNFVSLMVGVFDGY